jgi:flagellar basal body-associated protein FliL
MKKIITIILITIILFLLAGYVYFYFQYSDLKNKYNVFLEIDRINEKIVIFNKLFVGKILMAEGEVSYDDRLKLENAANDTQDEEIINEWHYFLNSKTEEEAQERTKNLLNLFINKIIY